MLVMLALALAQEDSFQVDRYNSSNKIPFHNLGGAREKPPSPQILRLDQGATRTNWSAEGSSLTRGMQTEEVSQTMRVNSDN